MLVFAAFVPHPIIAVPDVGKEHTPKIRATMRAYRELAHELYAAKAESLICISPHAFQISGAFTINQRPALKLAFTSFGNLSDSMQLTNDIGLGYDIRESVEHSTPIVLIESEELDYGMSIPLFYLLRGYAPGSLKIVPIGTTESLSLQQHYDLGAAINRNINDTTKRVAVIASGDLSQGATKRSIAGHVPAAQSFNAFIRDTVAKNDLRSLPSFSAELYPDITECALRPLSILAGILDDRSYHTKILSFEAPMGVGVMAAQLQAI